MFGKMRPLEGAVQTAEEMERRYLWLYIEIQRKKLIQEVLQWSVTFKQTIIPESHRPCERFAFFMVLKREFSLILHHISSHVFQKQ